MYHAELVEEPVSRHTRMDHKKLHKGFCSSSRDRVLGGSWDLLSTDNWACVGLEAQLYVVLTPMSLPRGQSPLTSPLHVFPSAAAVESDGQAA